MNETIREHIRRRERRLLLIALSAWLCIPSALVVTEGRTQVLILIPAVLVLPGALVAGMLVKCPKCQTRLGELGLGMAFNIARPRACFCPYCGVRFDTGLLLAVPPKASPVLGRASVDTPR